MADGDPQTAGIEPIHLEAAVLPRPALGPRQRMALRGRSPHNDAGAGDGHPRVVDHLAPQRPSPVEPDREEGLGPGRHADLVGPGDEAGREGHHRPLPGGHPLDGEGPRGVLEPAGEEAASPRSSSRGNRYTVRPAMGPPEAASTALPRIEASRLRTRSSSRSPGRTGTRSPGSQPGAPARRVRSRSSRWGSSHSPPVPLRAERIPPCDWRRRLRSNSNRGSGSVSTGCGSRTRVSNARGSFASALRTQEASEPGESQLSMPSSPERLDHALPDPRGGPAMTSYRLAEAARGMGRPGPRSELLDWMFRNATGSLWPAKPKWPRVRSLPGCALVVHELRHLGQVAVEDDGAVQLRP